MKKITSKEAISFKVNGQTTLEIDKKGAICSDEEAEIASDRLGGNINIEDITPEDAKKEAEKILKETEKAVKEADAEKIKEKTEKEAKKKSDKIKEGVEKESKNK
jgi:hypothetical protein